MSDIQKQEPIPERPGVTVVTNENFDEYVEQQLGPTPESMDDDDIGTGSGGVSDETPEAKAAKELEAVEAEREQNLAPKEGDVEGSKVFWKGKWVNKSDYSYRMHLKTETARVAEEKAARLESEIKAERESRIASENRAKELQNKYEPPKPDYLGPEPNPAQFTDVNEYSKALKEWTADVVRREEAAKQFYAKAAAEKEKVVSDFQKRQDAAKTELPDYADKIAKSPVQISDQMRDAILESDIGPKILYHLAEHPEVADSLGKMTVQRMFREFGKLEAKLSGEPQQNVRSALAEVSRAPAPITPLRGANAPVARLSGADEWHGTFDEYKRKRAAGLIR